MKYSLRSLPLQLFTLLALPLLAVLMLITFGSVALHRAAMRDLVTGHDVQAVRGVAASLSGQFEEHERVLIRLAERAAESDDPSSVVEDWSETMFDGGIALYDERGSLVAATANVDSWQFSSPLRPDLAEALANIRPGGETRFIPMIESRRNATWIALVVSPPVRSGGEGLVAMGVVSLDALDLPILLETLRTSGTASITLATPQGLILYQTDPLRVGSVLPADTPYQSALRGESGATYSREGRQETLVTFSPVTQPGWTLIQEELWTEMVSPLMRYSQAAPIALIPGLTILLIGAGFAISNILRPLQKLEARAADLAGGDFASIQEPVGGIEEIRRLQASLRQMADQLAKAQDLMRQYIAMITQAQEDERLRLAHELHDEMIQALIALDHRSQVLKRYLNDDPAGQDVLAEVRGMTAEAIEDLRRIIRAMRPIYLEDFGLVPALEVLARDCSASGDADVHFEKEGMPHRLPPEQEMTLYRVAQEALNNARRHSDASKIWLKVRFEPEEVIVSIRDNGVGFRAPKQVTDLPRNGHFGLIGMFERAELAGANLRIDSAPGRGTTITIRTKAAEAL